MTDTPTPQTDTDSNRVGLIVEGGATLEDVQALLNTEEAPDAMKYGGVPADTIRILEER